MFKEINDIYCDKYKSFQERIETKNIKNINLIIGRNNSGKSSLIDIIQSLINKGNNNTPEYIEFSSKLLDSDIKQVFSDSTYGGSKFFSRNETQYQCGKKFIGEQFIVRYNFKNKAYEFLERYNSSLPPLRQEKYWDKIASNKSSILSNYSFRRLDAERDISPEIESKSLSLSNNGNGASNIINNFINSSDREEKYVEETLLIELNKIMLPDSKFTQIRIQKISNNEWEIFLQEENSERFSLSQSGSGLKTIILILINLFLFPIIDGIEKSHFVYAFEEIENNLHPALQRRIFEYLYDFSIKNDVCMFITTHSHVAINAYFNKEHAQIMHVIKENNSSRLIEIDNNIDCNNILDDLDVRASDLFQSNGIIWVEGPSDRVYIKKWIDLFSDNAIEENIHYQFLYYGGRLLSHYTVNEEEDLIRILLTNRNSVIVIDSDKKDVAEQINATKQRIQNEFIQNKCLCWLTEGKEIENYIPIDAIKKKFNNNSLLQCGKYDLFPDYIENHYSNFKSKKVEFAKEIVESMTTENLSKMYDLKDKVSEMISKINSWNKI